LGSKSKGKIYEVTWIDAVSQTGWHPDHEPPPDPLPCKTTGYLVFEDEQAIRLAQTITQEDGIGNIMVIPSGMITKKRLIR